MSLQKENKNASVWTEVQTESKRLLNSWKMRNTHSQASSSSSFSDNETEKQLLLDENLSKELNESLENWHKNHSLDENQTIKFRNCAQCLLDCAKDNTQTKKWIDQNSKLIDSVKVCLNDIIVDGKYLDAEENNDPNLESFDILIQAFSDMENDELLDIIAQYVPTRFYIDTLKHLGDVNPSNLKLTQQFLLITCPNYVLTCDRDRSHCQKILECMLPQYNEVFSHFMPNVDKWTDSVVLCLLHLIQFVLSESSSLPFDKKIEIQDVLLIILFKQTIDASNIEQERVILLHTVLRVLFQLVRSDPKLLTELKKQATDDDLLLKVLKQLAKDNRKEKLQLSALELLALLVSEEEFKETKDLAEVSSLFVKNLKDAIEQGKDSTVDELLQGLKGLMSSQEIKQKVIEQNALPSIMQYTKENINDPTPLEVAYALSFNSDAKKVLSNDKEFVDHVKEMEKSDNEQVTKAAQGIIWKLEGEEKFVKEMDEKKADEKINVIEEKKQNEKVEDKKDPAEEYDMMISYSWAQKELCHKINDRLEADGYSVWLDRDEMHGSIVQAMSEAVEHSKCVLICMSSNYKMSTNCQAEAEYAYNRKSKIVPLLVEKDYKPDGWLGFMAGSKLYIDFADKEGEEFDKAYELLLAELKRNDLDIDSTDEEKKEEKLSSPDPVSSEPVPNEIEEPPIQTREYLNIVPATLWTDVNVNEFLLDHSLNQLIPICKAMNGKALVEFYDACQRMPCDMYRLIDKKDDHPMSIDVFFKFLGELKEYLPPPKPPQKMAFQCNFVYPPATTDK